MPGHTCTYSGTIFVLGGRKVDIHFYAVIDSGARPDACMHDSTGNRSCATAYGYGSCATGESSFRSPISAARRLSSSRRYPLDATPPQTTCARAPEQNTSVSGPQARRERGRGCGSGKWYALRLRISTFVCRVFQTLCDRTRCLMAPQLVRQCIRQMFKAFSNGRECVCVEM